MELTTWLQLIGGLAVLSFGADRLVEGASSLARRWGVPAVVIGLTVVSYGTSAPEMAVSAFASLNGIPDLAVSNVVGSNIFNILFILGLCALTRPLVVHSRMVRIDVPFMIGLSVLTLALLSDGRFSIWEAAIFMSGMAAYTVFTLRQTSAEPADVKREFEEAIASKKPLSAPMAGVLIAIALGLLILGTQWFVGGATSLAQALGVDDTIIGLTIVAAGTSMPEVFTSIVATIKGERDIAVGNVIGSNIFNLLGILGISGLLAGGRGLAVDPAMIRFDLPVMCVVAAACLPIFWSGHTITRREGALFFLGYCGYITFLIMKAKGAL
jgi:cation:H+ antiporter